jgi:hypothetical protein
VFPHRPFYSARRPNSPIQLMKIRHYPDDGQIFIRGRFR